MKKKKILWAPWRAKYIVNSDSGGCIFCEKSESSEDEKNLVLYRGKNAFSLLNIYPYNNGHVMIAPYEHVGELPLLKKEIFYEMQDIVRGFVGIMNEKMMPHGFNIGMNIGKPAGAGFDKHLHIHVVPRWNGDTNFMPVIGDQDVISESLESVYSKLRTKGPFS